MLAGTANLLESRSDQDAAKARRGGFASVVRQCAAAFLAFAYVLWASPIQAETQPRPWSLFPPAQTQETRPARVDIGPFTFDFPRNARDIQRNVEGRFEEMSMRVLYPTMEGETPENAWEMRLLSQQSRALQLLITDRLAQASRLGVDPDMGAHMLGLLRVYGSKHLFASPYENSDPEFIERAEKYGLVQFRVKPGHEGADGLSITLKRGRWVFVDLVGNDIRTVIECSGDEPRIVNPGCSIYFPYGDALRIKIGFRQSRLPDWRGIRDLFIRYLDEHRVY